MGEALQEPNSLSPVQRLEGISQKMQCGTTERSEFFLGVKKFKSPKLGWGRYALKF